MTTNNPHESPDTLTDAEAVYFAYNTRSGDGEAVDIDALCEQRPDLSTDLRDIHERWQRFRSVLRDVPATAEGPSGSESGTSPSEFIGKLAHHTPPKSRNQLLGQIAQGGMGAILKVWDAPLKRNLAMKVVLERTQGSTPAVEERALSLVP
jgi:hypothetical protein